MCVFEAVGGVCNTSSNTTSGLEGWWNGRSALLTSLSQCHAYDHPSGLHFIRYRAPANFSLPDEVSFQLISDSLQETVHWVTTCLENMEMSGILTVVRISLKVRKVSVKYLVSEKWR